MNKRLSRILSVGPLAFCVCVANAQERDGGSGRYYVAPMAAIATNQDDDGHDVVGGASLAIGTLLLPHLGVEIVGDYLRYTHIEHTYGAGLGANLYLSPDNDGVFIHADVLGGNRSSYHAGLGYDRPVFDRALSLRVEALWHKEGDDDGEALLRLGVRIPFGGAHSTALMTPEPVSVVPVDQPEASPQGEVAPQEEAGPAVAESAATEEVTAKAAVTPAEAADAAATVVEPASAPEPASKKKSPPQHYEKAPASVESRAAASPAIVEAAPVASEPANELPHDSAPVQDAASPPAESHQDEALAPTEPAPAPKRSPSVVEVPPEKASAATSSQAQPQDADDDTLAPTEPAPKPR